MRNYVGLAVYAAPANEEKPRLYICISQSEDAWLIDAHNPYTAHLAAPLYGLHGWKIVEASVADDDFLHGVYRRLQQAIECVKLCGLEPSRLARLNLLGLANLINRRGDVITNSDRLINKSYVGQVVFIEIPKDDEPDGPMVSGEYVVVEQSDYSLYARPIGDVRDTRLYRFEYRRPAGDDGDTISILWNRRDDYRVLRFAFDLIDYASRERLADDQTIPQAASATQAAASLHGVVADRPERDWEPGTVFLDEAIRKCLGDVSPADAEAPEAAGEGADEPVHADIEVERGSDEGRQYVYFVRDAFSNDVIGTFTGTDLAGSAINEAIVAEQGFPYEEVDVKVSRRDLNKLFGREVSLFGFKWRPKTDAELSA